MTVKTNKCKINWSCYEQYVNKRETEHNYSKEESIIIKRRCNCWSGKIRRREKIKIISNGEINLLLISDFGWDISFFCFVHFLICSFSSSVYCFFHKKLTAHTTQIINDDHIVYEIHTSNYGSISSDFVVCSVSRNSYKFAWVWVSTLFSEFFASRFFFLSNVIICWLAREKTIMNDWGK